GVSTDRAPRNPRQYGRAGRAFAGPEAPAFSPMFERYGRSHPGARPRPARYSAPHALDVQEPYIGKPSQDIRLRRKCDLLRPFTRRLRLYPAPSSHHPAYLPKFAPICALPGRIAACRLRLKGVRREPCKPSDPRRGGELVGSALTK